MSWPTAWQSGSSSSFSEHTGWSVFWLDRDLGTRAGTGAGMDSSTPKSGAALRQAQGPGQAQGPAQAQGPRQAQGPAPEKRPLPGLDVVALQEWLLANQPELLG